jgi:hypothetical protein
MAFDPDEMVGRFKARAKAARERALPPVAGEERKAFLRQQEMDYTDYSIIGAAEWSVDEGFLVLRIDMRPPGQANA